MSVSATVFINFNRMNTANIPALADPKVTKPCQNRAIAVSANFSMVSSSRMFIMDIDPFAMSLPVAPLAIVFKTAAFSAGR